VVLAHVEAVETQAIVEFGERKPVFVLLSARPERSFWSKTPNFMMSILAGDDLSRLAGRTGRAFFHSPYIQYS
jgi:hypothetical protein